MIRVSIDREKMKSYIKSRLRAEIAGRLGNWTHTNRDSGRSPSEWWVDKLNGSVRHQLGTDISASMSGDTIHIVLTYEVIDISPPPPDEGES